MVPFSLIRIKNVRSQTCTHTHIWLGMLFSLLLLFYFFFQIISIEWANDLFLPSFIHLLYVCGMMIVSEFGMRDWSFHSFCFCFFSLFLSVNLCVCEYVHITFFIPLIWRQPTIQWNWYVSWILQCEFLNESIIAGGAGKSY